MSCFAEHLIRDRHASLLSAAAKLDVEFGWYRLTDGCLSEITAVAPPGVAVVHAISSAGGRLHVVVDLSVFNQEARAQVADLLRTVAVLSRWSCVDCGQPGWVQPGEWQGRPRCRGHRLQARGVECYEA